MQRAVFLGDGTANTVSLEQNAELWDMLSDAVMELITYGSLPCDANTVQVSVPVEMSALRRVEGEDGNRVPNSGQFPISFCSHSRLCDAVAVQLQHRTSTGWNTLVTLCSTNTSQRATEKLSVLRLTPGLPFFPFLCPPMPTTRSNELSLAYKCTSFVSETLGKLAMPPHIGGVCTIDLFVTFLLAAPISACDETAPRA